MGRPDLELPVWGDRRRVVVGLLGGSFNPAHDGHRHISEEALRHLGLDEVWWLVSPQNPLKSRDEMMPLAERVASARAVADTPRIRVSAIETALGTGYTAEVLRLLKTRFPNVRFVWLMGADNLADIHRWRAWARIFRTVPIAVFARAPYSYGALVGRAATRYRRARVAMNKTGALARRRAPAWTFLFVQRHPASATAIRAEQKDDRGDASSSGR